MVRYVNDMYAATTITVDIVVDCILDKIAAATVKHPVSIKKRKRISEVKLTILNDVVASAENSIKSHKFEIISQGQSHKDYTYYIRFYPITKDGVKLDDVLIIFRIADHKSKQIEVEAENPKVVIKSFVLSGKAYSNSVEFIKAFNDICEGLYTGDISVLDRYE